MLLDCKASFVYTSGLGDVDDLIYARLSGEREGGLRLLCGVKRVVPDAACRAVGNCECHVAEVRPDGRHYGVHHAEVTAFDRKLDNTTIIIVPIFTIILM